MDAKISDKKYLVMLVLVFLAVVVWSAINPFGRGIWYVEISSVLIVFFALIFTYSKFQFSKTSYTIIFAWLILHTIGAHYSFELVPFDFITELFNFSRNNFDRLAHFIIGLNSFCVAEFFLKTKKVSSVGVAAFVGILFIMAMANAWELIEWIYAALDGGEVGAAFLGSQGDIWDAQKDMLADTLGAFLGAFLFMILYRNPKKKS